jgi:hypothetical protein
LSDEKHNANISRIEQNVQVGQEWKQNKVLVDQDQSRNAKIKQNVEVGQEWKQNKMLIDQDQSRKKFMYMKVQLWPKHLG